MAKLERTDILKPSEVEMLQALALPEEVKVKGLLGRGRRSFACRGEYGGKDVVVKVYRKEFVEKYWKKCCIDIAEFEYERNTILYDIDEIRPYIARPYRVFTRHSAFTHSFIQEYIEGITLKQLITRSGYLPDEVLEAGYQIVKCAEAHGVHDMDIYEENVLVTRSEGTWMPKLYDFNLLPQHISPPNPFIALGIKMGLRSKSCRDYRNLGNWKRTGERQHLSYKN